MSNWVSCVHFRLQIFKIGRPDSENTIDCCSDEELVAWGSDECSDQLLVNLNNLVDCSGMIINKV